MTDSSNPKHAWGYVEDNGKTKSGASGISVVKSGKTYVVTFKPGFDSTPSVQATAIAGSGNTRIANVTAVKADSCKVGITNGGGNERENAFCLLAVGN